MEEALIKRIMPNSLEAEQSVIGSMIMDKDAIVTVMEMLSQEDFYHQQYGLLFQAMVELYNAGQPVDLVTLQNKLRSMNVPSEVSSLEFIRDLLTAIPTSANVKYYAQIVKDKAVLRRLIKITEEIENQCYADTGELEDILADTERNVFGLLQNRTGSCLWIERFTKYRNITELTRHITVTLIDRIMVFEDCRIDIRFRYQYDYERALELIRNMQELCPADAASYGKEAV